MSLSFGSPNLTLHPPRSPHVRLGGFVVLPRLIDKARAVIAGQQGVYVFNSPLDRKFLSFVDIEATALLDFIKTGQGDGAILGWIIAHSPRQPDAAQIAAWSDETERFAPDSPEGRERRVKQIAGIAPHRTDIATSFDYLDLDDYVSFGGKP